MKMKNTLKTQFANVRFRFRSIFARVFRSRAKNSIWFNNNVQQHAIMMIFITAILYDIEVTLMQWASFDLCHAQFHSFLRITLDCYFIIMSELRPMKIWKDI